MLSKVVSKNQRDWDTYVPLLMLAYRSAPHETLGESPNNMMFGREVHMPIDLIYGVYSPDSNLSRPEYIDQLTSRMDKVHNVVRDRLVHAAAQHKRRYDLTSKNYQYKVGDGVMLKDSKKYKGRSPKCQFKWEGPFTVIKQLSDILYQIQEGPKSKTKIIHVNRLKPCKVLPRDTPRHTGSVRSSVERVGRTFPSRSQTVITHPSTITSQMQSEATIQQTTALLDEQMPDFAELLNEPRTPSPMKRLRNEMTTPILSPSLLVPSDILFSKYLEPVSPEPFKTQ
ncbi:unnamed protein product [Mytilus coruscus]|uniref:Integrase p58-like C-terminal domain-containing protein n=1 Tax=Mytilus coruscus TaxID=42192 RepID=A0A6J8EBL6_MYTCO|nr:unnamed protein product [Mytilus coruscus]